MREWASAQAASGYLEYDADGETFTLTPEVAMAFADENSPVYLLGGYSLIGSVYKDRDELAERFRSGDGFGWHEHDPELFVGTEQFFRPGYRTHLIAEWIPALAGVEDKLKSGGKVADIGCGHGISTMLMAKAYPESTVYGFDYHDASIARAAEIAEAGGAAENTEFAVASAKDYPGEGYDLVAFFDCLHDMGDPVGAMTHVRRDDRGRRRGDAGRAVRGRLAGREPQPGRADLLRRLDRDLHAVFTRPGGRAGSGGPGRRRATAGCRRGGGVHPVPAGDRDTVQPRVGGSPVATVVGCDTGRDGCAVPARGRVRSKPFAAPEGAACRAGGFVRRPRLRSLR